MTPQPHDKRCSQQSQNDNGIAMPRCTSCEVVDGSDVEASCSDEVFLNACEQDGGTSPLNF